MERNDFFEKDRLLNICFFFGQRIAYFRRHMFMWFVGLFVFSLKLWVVGVVFCLPNALILLCLADHSLKLPMTALIESFGSLD